MWKKKGKVTFLSMSICILLFLEHILHRIWNTVLEWIWGNPSEVRHCLISVTHKSPQNMNAICAWIMLYYSFCYTVTLMRVLREMKQSVIWHQRSSHRQHMKPRGTDLHTRTLHEDNLLAQSDVFTLFPSHSHLGVKTIQKYFFNPWKMYCHKVATRWSSVQCDKQQLFILLTIETFSNEG